MKTFWVFLSFISVVSAAPVYLYDEEPLPIPEPLPGPEFQTYSDCNGVNCVSDEVRFAHQNVLRILTV